MSNKGMIAVHVGAGSHSQALHAEYKSLMKRACNIGASLLKDGKGAAEAVCAATAVLEDSDLTNAGFGSSLTLEGRVECDAGVMDGCSLKYGACGAVCGVKNPVTLAKAILVEQDVELIGGLVQPNFLVGEGAEKWGQVHGVTMCEPESLISSKSARVYSESVQYLESFRNSGRKRRNRSPDDEEQDGVEGQSTRSCISKKETNSESGESEIVVEGRLDTVGAVAIDCNDNVASAVSSGGLLLKSPGRVGQAAVYGSGCWAENDCNESGVGVAVSTSGCGEHLVKTMLAHNCAQAAVNSLSAADLSQFLTKKFIHSPFLKKVSKPMGGALILSHNSNGDTDLYWIHSTQSMGVAFVDLKSSKVQTLFSELEQSKVGKTFEVGCKYFSLKSDSHVLTDTGQG